MNYHNIQQPENQLNWVMSAGTGGLSDVVAGRMHRDLTSSYIKITPNSFDQAPVWILEPAIE